MLTLEDMERDYPDKLGKPAQVFEFKDDDGGDFGTLHFWVDLLTDLVATEREAGRIEIVGVGVSADDVAHMLDKRGVERDHVEAMPLSRCLTPVLICELPNGTHLIVDGHHRFVRAFLADWDSVPACIIPEHVWRRCLLAVDPRSRP